MINNDISKLKDMDFRRSFLIEWFATKMRTITNKFRYVWLSFITLYRNNFVIFWKIDRHVSITWISISSFICSILNFLAFCCYVKRIEWHVYQFHFLFLLLFHSIFICSFYNVFTMIYTIELYRILKRNMILYRFSYKNKIFLDFLSFKFMKT